MVYMKFLRMVRKRVWENHMVLAFVNLQPVAIAENVLVLRIYVRALLLCSESLLARACSVK